MQGGMLRAVSMITEAKKSSLEASAPLIVDLHPARPDYRGFMVGNEPISMQADPSFAEIESLGGRVEKLSDAHTALGDLFLVSGEIPRVTPYETGIKGGIRFDKQKDEWEKDESISDERFLMCNLKGLSPFFKLLNSVDVLPRKMNSYVHRLQSRRRG